jgi:hypothetical protein
MYQDLYARLSQNMPVPEAPMYNPAPAPAPAAYAPASTPYGVQSVDAPTPGPAHTYYATGAPAGAYGARAPASAAKGGAALPPSLGGPGARSSARR